MGVLQPFNNKAKLQLSLNYIPKMIYNNHLLQECPKRSTKFIIETLKEKCNGFTRLYIMGFKNIID